GRGGGGGQGGAVPGRGGRTRRRSGRRRGGPARSRSSHIPLARLEDGGRGGRRTPAVAPPPEGHPRPERAPTAGTCPPGTDPRTPPAAGRGRAAPSRGRARSRRPRAARGTART